MFFFLSYGITEFPHVKIRMSVNKCRRHDVTKFTSVQDMGVYEDKVNKIYK